MRLRPRSHVSYQAIALGIPFEDFALREVQYTAAFVYAMAAALHLPSDAVTVTTFQPSVAGTTVVFFAVSLFGTSSSSSAVVVADSLAIQNLFVAAGAGSAATPAFLAALHAVGLSNVGAAYYLDQDAPTPAATPSAGRKLLSRLRRLGRG